jgi:hypothetical protein
MWKLRRHCMQMPNILPRLLDAVNWNSRDDMTHLYLLLQEWPQVNNKEGFCLNRHLFIFDLTTIILRYLFYILRTPFKQPLLN